jgi:hypothetical protein
MKIVNRRLHATAVCLCRTSGTHERQNRPEDTRTRMGGF